jgi:aspartate ammonia-lyase
MGVTVEPLYGEQTRLTIENMSFSGRYLRDYPEVIKAMAAVKKAAALANRGAGQLDPAVAERIVWAASQLEAGQHFDQFPVDAFHGGGAVGLNMNVNEVIGTLAQASPTDEVNLSQSTNDVCATAMRIAAYRAHRRLISALARVADSAELVGHRGEGIQTIARTCLQDGLPVPAGRLFTALASAVRRQLDHLQTAADALLSVRLGGTVIGSSVGAPGSYVRHVVEELADVTGLPVTRAPDLFDATEYPDDVARLSGNVATACHILAKFAQDLRLLSSGPECGLEELILPAVQAGSTFFPGKVNPVIPETVIQCDILVTGNDAAIQRCLAMGEGHLNLWEETMCFLLLDNIRMLTKAALLFDEHCLSGVQFNAEISEGYAHSAIPEVVTIKETEGYARTSSAIKELGIDEFLRRHRAGEERR